MRVRRLYAIRLNHFLEQYALACEARGERVKAEFVRRLSIPLVLTYP